MAAAATTTYPFVLQNKEYNIGAFIDELRDVMAEEYNLMNYVSCLITQTRDMGRILVKPFRFMHPYQWMPEEEEHFKTRLQEACMRDQHAEFVYFFLEYIRHGYSIFDAIEGAAEPVKN